jgi:hypothetical protein
MQKMFNMATICLLENCKSTVTLSNVLGMSHKISQITPEMLQNLRNACYYRFIICQERNGAHFEQLLH